MKTIKLTGKNGLNMFAIIDDSDFELVNKYKWHLSGLYPVRSFGKRPKRTKISLHRFLMNPATNMVVDHINGNGLDNRRDNLRVCTVSQNTMNSKKGTRSSSRFKGVTKNKLWRAYIGNKTIGCFDSEEEAGKAYDSKARELYGEFANLNFPIK